MAEENKSPEGQAGAQEAPKKKISLPVILLGVQVLLLVVATGVLGKFVLMAPKPDLSPPKLAERAIASVQDDEGLVRYMPLEEFTVNLPDNHSLQAKLTLEVSNENVEGALKARLPVIRAKVLEVLGQQKGQETDTLKGKLLLKDSIRTVLNELLAQLRIESGDGIVREVLFVNLVLL